MVKMSVPTYSHDLFGILCDIVLSFNHVALKSRHLKPFFIISSMSLFIMIQYMDLLASSLVSMPMRFRGICFCALSCSTAGIFILMAFHCNAIYDCNLISEWPVWLQVFLHLSFDSQLRNISSNNMPMCSSSGITICTCSVVIQSSLSMHESIALMVIHMLGIPLSLPHGCV